MQPKFFKVATIGQGYLATMARPRAGDWADEEFSGFADAGLKRIVSLLEYHENWELGLVDEPRYCDEAGIGFLSWPLPDRGVPGKTGELFELSLDIYQRCAGGENTAIHCRGGIGRSSLVAAAILLHTGLSVDEALGTISSARGLQVPDTEEQREWLLDYAARHHSSG